MALTTYAKNQNVQGVPYFGTNTSAKNQKVILPLTFHRRKELHVVSYFWQRWSKNQEVQVVGN